MMVLLKDYGGMRCGHALLANGGIVLDPSKVFDSVRRMVEVLGLLSLSGVERGMKMNEFHFCKMITGILFPLITFVHSQDRI